MLMAFVTISHAQEKTDLRLLEKVLHPTSLRNSIAPEKVGYQTNDGGAVISFRDEFSYDENEFFLSNITTYMEDLGEWIPYSMKTYDYNYNLVPTEILQQKWDGSWINDQRILLSYNDDDFMPLVEEEVYQQWENNNWVNVRKLIYSYDPNKMILVKEWNGNSFENSYLYTFENTFNHTSVLFQYYQGGAWQNQEKTEISYNGNNEITEQIYQEWINLEWNNVEKTSYWYDDPYKLNKVVKTLWENNAWSDDKTKIINYTYDWMGNSTHAYCQSNYGGAEEFNTDIEIFYNEGESMTYENVKELTVKYVDVTRLQEHPTASQFIIAPNPIDDRIQISGEQFMKAEVYTLTGQKVLESVTPTITLNGISSGAYLLKIQDRNGHVETQKVLVR